MDNGSTVDDGLLRLVETDDKGRALLCRAACAAGTLLLREKPLAALRSHRPSLDYCGECLRVAPASDGGASPALVRCASCNAVARCATCRPHHRAHGRECDTLGRVARGLASVNFSFAVFTCLSSGVWGGGGGGEIRAGGGGSCLCV